MFPHSYFAAAYFSDVYFPPILGEPYVPTSVFIMWICGGD
jgi:hypothetical protein